MAGTEFGLTERSRRAVVFLALAMVAAAFRFPRLAARPMHCDEAVNADRFGTLLEQGRYEYSTLDFHGPTLQYLTLVAARAKGIARYADLNEVTLRAVPAVLGVLLVAAHFLLVPYVGLPAAACAGLFTAVSPAMVYYSRYYIHETLFVFLTFCTMLAVFGYVRRRSRWRALGVGALVGLMYATKETWIIAAACMTVAGCTLVGRTPWGVPSGPAAPLVGLLAPYKRLMEWLRQRDEGVGVPSGPGSGGPPHSSSSSHSHSDWKSTGQAQEGACKAWQAVALAAAAAVLIAMLLMSSFLTHPRGIVDSVLAYRTYFARGSGLHTAHVHPWHFYFDRLLYFHSAGAPVFTEALIAALALVGLAVAFGKPGVPRFLALYTLLMVAVYSAVPYKAPWNLLGFLHGMILLAGIGLAWMANRARRLVPKIAVVALVGIGVAHLGWQARAASIEYGADPRNPWVYAHTGTDVFLIAKQIEALASAYPGGHALPIQVVTRENLWPLPWYLRRFPATRWWNGVSETAPSAPVILATPDMEPALVHKLYDLPPPGQREMYVNMFDRYVELRPRVEVRGYVAKSLWDNLPEAP